MFHGQATKDAMRWPWDAMVRRSSKHERDVDGMHIGKARGARVYVAVAQLEARCAAMAGIVEHQAHVVEVELHVGMAKTVGIAQAQLHGEVLCPHGASTLVLPKAVAKAAGEAV